MKESKNQTYALFLGCTVPVRGRNYEMSARKVAEILGIRLVDINDFNCCGFPVKGNEYEFTITICANNLALAEELGLDMCVLCSACTASLSEVNHEFHHDEKLRERINKHLQAVNREYKGTVKVRHFNRILYEDFGPEKIKKLIKKDLSMLTLAAHYGCHYLKPTFAHENFDSVENPVSIEKMILATGAKVADLGGQKHCCGGAVLPVDEQVSYRMSADKLNLVATSGADAICLVCPFCAVMYDDNQKKIASLQEVAAPQAKVEGQIPKEYDLPALYYPQLLGLALGIEPNELGLNLNKVKTKELLAKLEGSSSTGSI